MSLKITHYRERLRVFSYRVMLDIQVELVLFVSRLLAEHRRQIATRKGPAATARHCPGLAWFRDKGDISRLGASFGLPQSTAYRYLDPRREALVVRDRCAASPRPTPYLAAPRSCRISGP